MSKKVAVILSGCGHMDGTEITEAVSCLISLAQYNLQYECFAPSVEFSEVDHLTKEETGKKRNVLSESGRIARGKIKPLSDLNVQDFDGLVMPGGYGAAKNLSTFATQGSEGSVQENVASAIAKFHESSKPIMAVCIAPAVIALALGKKGVNVTIGNDEGTSQEIKKTGAEHTNCEAVDFIVDRENKVISTPAYMYDSATPYHVFTGIQKAVQKLSELV